MTTGGWIIGGLVLLFSAGALYLLLSRRNPDATPPAARQEKSSAVQGSPARPTQSRETLAQLRTLKEQEIAMLKRQLKQKERLETLTRWVKKHPDRTHAVLERWMREK